MNNNNMKTVNEFKFIFNECGLFNAGYYIYYKAKLKIFNLTSLKKYQDINKLRIEKIYAALSILNNKSVTLRGKKYIEIRVQNFPNFLVYLRPYSSDKKVFEQVLIKEEYKPVVEIYDQMFKTSPANIIDCGSNIGLASVYFHWFYPNANFTAIEPFHENVEVLRLNLESNGLKNYKVLEVGVWNKNIGLVINKHFRDKKEWAISLEESSKEQTDIPGNSLLELIGNNEIDILKMDIEGAEKVLFDDSEYAMFFLSKIKCLAIEIHDEFNIRSKIYSSLKVNNFFYYNTDDITIAINRKYLLF
jgi:FkbM family methyltransferase